MTNQEKAKSLLERYNESDKTGQKIYWVKASCLYQWQRDDLWQYLFHGAGTWSEFLSKLKVATSSAQQKIKNYRFFVVKHNFKVSQLEDYDSSSLYCIAQNAEEKTKEQVMTLIGKSNDMTRDEFIAYVKGVEPCPHIETVEISETVEKCLTCKKKIHQL